MFRALALCQSENAKKPILSLKATLMIPGVALTQISAYSSHNRELKQTRTATATWGARKRLFPYFWRLCNSAYSYRGSNFFRFCQSFYCFIVSNYGRATVLISQNDAHVLTTTCKWSNWSRTWGTTTPRSCQFHIFTCSFCFLQLVLLFHWRCRRGLPSWCLSSPII